MSLPNPDTLYQKTPAGKLEIQQRGHGLSPATRALLIRLNGQTRLRELQGPGDDDIGPRVEHLLALGLIEPMATVKKPVPPPPPVPAPRAPAPVLANGPPRAAPAPAPDLAALRQVALQRLYLHFGPETSIAAAPLVQAQTPEEFSRAIGLMVEKLAIYLGKKAAQAELAGLQPWLGK